jgi:hypothetical protein
MSSWPDPRPMRKEIKRREEEREKIKRGDEHESWERERGHQIWNQAATVNKNWIDQLWQAREVEKKLGIV